MSVTVEIVLAVIALGGLILLVEEIKSLINKGNSAEKDAKVLDLTKKIQQQKINIDGKEKTAQELLDEYRKQAEEYHKFDSESDPNKPAS